MYGTVVEMATAQPRTTTTITKQHPVAYFSAEYGFDTRLPLYAGGLGILSGDTLKAAADSHTPFIGFGLLYKGKLMKQVLDTHGWQHDHDWDFEPSEVGLAPAIVDDQPLFVKVDMVGHDIWLQVWEKKFSEEVKLYLLDADNSLNHPHEQLLTQFLYTGSMEYQIKQQLLFCTGAITAMEELGIDPALYHLNEGRPAFITWELIKRYMERYTVTYHAAKSLVKDKTVYTNHTLVAAGNQGYPAAILGHYARQYADAFGLTVEQLLSDGVEDDPNVFKITRFALNSSKKANGVSELHSQLSAEQWPEYNWTNVTNGVHMPTWQAPEIEAVKSDVHQLWNTHSQLKRPTMEYMAEAPGGGYGPNEMVMVWARRLAGYKRVSSLVADIERLRAILKHRDRPVQLLIAGKAHQGDTEGKKILQQLVQYMSRELADSALFVPNYCIEVAQHLTRGTDLWINTPEHGREACGTSGMKACSNGILQCTVADGWAAEVAWDQTGWILDHDNISESVYTMLEEHITPLFYDRDDSGVPHQWVQMMQRSIAFKDRFSAQTMLQNYQQQLYT